VKKSAEHASKGVRLASSGRSPHGDAVNRDDQERDPGLTGDASPALTAEGDAATERGEQRDREDREFTPVIVKRTDEARRHPDDILEVAIQEGYEQLDRPLVSLALSSVAAGLIIGFTAMAVGLITTAAQDVPSAILRRLAAAFVYPLGFVLCLMSGSELFTEHTATALYPVLDRRKGAGSLLRLWLVVAAGNLVGAAMSGGLLSLADPVVGARLGYTEIAVHAVSAATLPLLISSVLAGWLMALGAWLILATPPTFSQLVCIDIVTFLIGLGGLHHSIAGAAEVFVGMLVSNEVSVNEACRFIVLALAGNLAGGSVFVGALNYAHIRRTRTVRTK
jgi:formate/nitrite transporter FocA (FNT family)